MILGAFVLSTVGVLTKNQTLAILNDMTVNEKVYN